MVSVLVVVEPIPKIININMVWKNNGMNRHCDKCDKDLTNYKGNFGNVEQYKKITVYGIDDVERERTGHGCDNNCGKEAESRYRNNPLILKGKLGNYYKYEVERAIFNGMNGNISGLKKVMGGHKDTQDGKDTKPANNTSDNRERERERQKWNQMLYE